MAGSVFFQVVLPKRKEGGGALLSEKDDSQVSAYLTLAISFQAMIVMIGDSNTSAPTVQTTANQ